MKKFAGMFLVAGLAFAQAPAYKTVASTKHLMAGVVKPSADALNAIAKAGGPKDDAEWAQVAQHAALMAEAGNLLHMGGRPKDDVWTKAATQLTDGFEGVSKAAAEKNLETYKTAMSQGNGSCRPCHQAHRVMARPGGGQGGGAAAPAKPPAQ